MVTEVDFRLIFSVDVGESRARPMFESSLKYRFKTFTKELN